jgi:hypothetical protein
MAAEDDCRSAGVIANICAMRSWYYAAWCTLAACGEVGGSGVTGEVIVTQTNADTISGGVACTTAAMPRYVREQSFYRGFAFDDYDIRGAFHIRKVTFGFYSALAGGGAVGQPGDVTIYTYGGAIGGDTLDLSKTTKLGMAQTFTIPNTPTPATYGLDTSIDVPAGTDAIVVELHIRDGLAAMHQLSVGTNTRGERMPGYQRAPGCSFAAPVTLGTAGFPTAALVLAVTGDAS